MRWPLRNQILIRLLSLVVVAIVGVTLANIRSTILFQREHQREQFRQISEILTKVNFPLTENVLENMRSLSGAEFAVLAADESVLAKTAGIPIDFDSFKLPTQGISDIDLEQTVVLDDRSFFYSSVALQPKATGVRSLGVAVNVFISQENYRELWWRAIKTPLVIAAIVLTLTFLISLALANDVTRPLGQLREQVQHIASGDLAHLPPTNRNDEIYDLNVSVNEMATQLENHDEQLRQNERLNTLVQLGSGIAHNLRNCATGCKMAIELLACEDEKLNDSENLQVAKRQLKLMNKYIERFLTLAASDPSPSESPPHQTCDLAQVLDSVVFLLKPSAQHLKVTLSSANSVDSPIVKIPLDDAEQLMINLVSNAIRAASEHALSIPNHSATVRIELSNVGANKIEFSVIDNGAGPPHQIADKMFEPFVSGTPEGTGLGLSLVHDIVERADGEVSWIRSDDMTRFAVELDQSLPSQT